MPPTLEKLKGHIALGLPVCPSVRPSLGGAVRSLLVFGPLGLCLSGLIGLIRFLCGSPLPFNNLSTLSIRVSLTLSEGGTVLSGAMVAMVFSGPCTLAVVFPLFEGELVFFVLAMPMLLARMSQALMFGTFRLCCLLTGRIFICLASGFRQPTGGMPGLLCRYRFPTRRPLGRDFILAVIANSSSLVTGRGHLFFFSFVVP